MLSPYYTMRFLHYFYTNISVCVFIKIYNLHLFKGYVIFFPNLIFVSLGGGGAGGGG